MVASGGVLKILGQHVVHTKIFVWPSGIFKVFSKKYLHYEKLVYKNSHLAVCFVTQGQTEGEVY